MQVTAILTVYDAERLTEEEKRLRFMLLELGYRVETRGVRAPEPAIALRSEDGHDIPTSVVFEVPWW